MLIPRAHRLAVMSLFFAAVACSGAQKTASDPTDEATDGDKSGSSSAVGQPAPDLSIQTVNGKGDIGLNDLHGKVVVVDFWATWCGPCRQSFPVLEALSRKHGGKVAIVGVSVNDEPDGVADFAKELGTTFPIGWDKDHAIAQRWKVESMPTTYVVDEKGTVRYVHAGYHGDEGTKLQNELSKLLSKTDSSSSSKPAPSPDTKVDPAPAPSPEATQTDDAPPVVTKSTKKTGKAKPTKKRSSKKKRRKTDASS